MAAFDPPTSSISMASQNANTYSDLNGLASLKNNPKSPQAIHGVAEQIDALFLQMMLKSMRQASAEVGEHQSNELGMYQDLFDKQIALSISARGGLGIGAMIARQLEAQAGGGAPAAAIAEAGPAPPAGAGAKAGAYPLPATATAGRGYAPALPFNPAASGTAAPAPGTAGPAPATTLATAAAFVSRVLPAIRNAAQALGVNPTGLLAQAVLETGWGRRMARTANGAPSMNLFGIKADAGWDGERAGAPTVEFAGGVASMRNAAFRAYGSIEESVDDFAKLLKDSPRYRQAIAAGQNIQAYIEGIAKSGYATDPGYANKLNGILQSGVFRAALHAAMLKL